MTEKYFAKFQPISYAGHAAINITERAAMRVAALADDTAFYPLDIPVGMRADQVADKYYGDPYMSWLVYLSGGRLDPYYDWPCDAEQLGEIIKKKWGSAERAQKLIAYYRNDWAGGAEITPARYNSLTIPETRYFEPVYGIGATISSYSRVQEDWTVSTNKIARYAANGTNFAVGEPVTITFSQNVTGNGQVAHVNSTSVDLQHLTGIVASNNTVTISGDSCVTGHDTGTNSSIMTAVVIVTNIPEVETTYWSPVTMYDLELERNAANKSIRLLDSSLGSMAAVQLKKLLAQ